MNRLTSSIDYRLVLLVAIVIGVIFIVILFRRIRRDDDEEIKTGFLGKPLFQFVLLFNMFAALLGGVYLSNKQQEEQVVQVSGEIQLNVDYKIKKEFASSKEIEFEVVPLVNDKKWGIEGRAYDFTWKFVALSNIEELAKPEFVYTQKNKTKADPPELLITLKNANYELNVTVSDGVNTASEQIILELE